LHRTEPSRTSFLLRRFYLSSFSKRDARLGPYDTASLAWAHTEVAVARPFD
jgi:hypothetical protein